MSLNEILGFLAQQSASFAVASAEKDAKVKGLEDDVEYLQGRLRAREEQGNRLYERQASDERELNRLRALAARYETEAAELRPARSRYETEGESLAKIGFGDAALLDMKRTRCIEWVAKNVSPDTYPPPGKVGKIEAIRVCRDVLNLDLRAAKEFIETLPPFVATIAP